MIVACPQCGTKFELPPEHYRPGRKARCSNCGNVFPLPDLEEAEGAEGEVSASSSGREHAGAEGAAEPKGRNGALPPPPVSVEDAVLDSAGKKKAGSGRKKIILVAVGLIVLALLGAGVFFLYPQLFPAAQVASPAASGDARTSPSPEGKSDGAPGDAEEQSAVRRLALEKVRQYTVTENTQNGRMVVVEGSVVNNFDTPKDLILLEITLYDEKGKALMMREQYCGVTLSLIQLKTLPKSALESALNNQTNILTNNTDIPPGGSVPFMTVFFNLPSSAYEFEVKIVDVKDSVPKK